MSAAAGTAPAAGARRIGENPYGYFDGTAREYVITRPDTPTPWMNYIGDGRYGGIVSNTGGGYSFDRDPRHRRVTRYRYNGVPGDQPGRYVYLRDQVSGDYWSATWQPVQRELDRYECRHGAGYTRIAAERAGIASELLYFVPPGSTAGESPPCELWVLRVANRGDRARTVRTFTYAEFGYPDAAVDQQNLDWAQHIVRSGYDGRAIVAGTAFEPDLTFFASDTPAIGFDSDRETFLGRSRDLARPLVVERGEPTNAGSANGNSVGALCHELHLEPGAERELVFVLGIAAGPGEVEGLLCAYADRAAAEAAFSALRADWNGYLAQLTVSTPDPELDAMVNVWNQIQCRTTLFWSRFASAYETGLGRGIGTRDSAQDTLGTVHAAPGRARATLRQLWRLQFGDGHTWHQLYPLTGEGSTGLAAELPERPQWFCDDHLWLVIATCAYIRETGDLEHLHERIAFADGGEATVWEHMRRAIAFTLAHRGPHGLPRIGFADWDDTLNIDLGSGKAESVWCAMQLSRALHDLAEVAEASGRGGEAGELLAAAREQAAAVNDHAWDGAWYARAFDDDGRPIGVAAEERHRINMNTQTWAVIGDVAPRERAETALESMDELLATDLGIALLWPPYDGADPRVRGTSTYPPGAKENGGIFCHANAWAIVAAAMAGWGDRAYAYYRRILPLARADSDRFLVEPYVYCQNVCGPTHPRFGMGRNSWLTGTAAWTFVAATQWLLGIRPTCAGLRVAPALPSSWAGFTASRVFRGALYEIAVERVGPGARHTVAVDGAPIDGDVVPLVAPGGRACVEVRIGA